MKQNFRMAALGAALVAVIVACNSSTSPDPNVPTLVSPEENAVMDNGCVTGGDSIAWTFQWSAVPNATSYELFVGHIGDAFAFIDDSTSQTTFHYDNVGGYTSALAGWHWWVRATVNGVKQGWAGPRDFTVETINTDCP